MNEPCQLVSEAKTEDILTATVAAAAMLCVNLKASHGTEDVLFRAAAMASPV